MALLRASAGKSHSNVTPTTESPKPSANRISLAAGRNEQILIIVTQENLQLTRICCVLQPGTHVASIRKLRRELLKKELSCQVCARKTEWLRRSIAPSPSMSGDTNARLPR